MRLVGAGAGTQVSLGQSGVSVLVAGPDALAAPLVVNLQLYTRPVCVGGQEARV